MKHILVVEDEPQMRQGLIDNLAFEGYEVSSAEDGQDGLTKVRSGNFDLVLLDVMLPGINGFDICARIRAQDREQPIIMLTVDEIEEATVKLLGAFGARPNVAFRTRSVEAVRSLVATGAGIALLPDLVYRPWSLEGDRIDSRDVSGSLPMVQVGIVRRKGSTLP